MLIRIKGLLQIQRAKGKHSWLIQILLRNSGGSYHMGSSKEDFSSLNQSKVPHIFMGNKSKMEVGGKGNVEMELGEFKMFSMFPT